MTPSGDLFDDTHPLDWFGRAAAHEAALALIGHQRAAGKGIRPVKLLRTYLRLLRG